jgi:hypothetical protein
MFVLWNIVLICGESGMEKRKGICVINGVLSDDRCVVGMHDRWHVGGLVHFGTFPWQAGGGTVSSSRDIDWMKYDMRLFLRSCSHVADMCSVTNTRSTYSIYSCRSGHVEKLWFRKKMK